MRGIAQSGIARESSLVARDDSLRELRLVEAARNGEHGFLQADFACAIEDAEKRGDRTLVTRFREGLHERCALHG